MLGCVVPTKNQGCSYEHLRGRYLRICEYRLIHYSLKYRIFYHFWFFVECRKLVCKYCRLELIFDGSWWNFCVFTDFQVVMIPLQNHVLYVQVIAAESSKNLTETKLVNVCVETIFWDSRARKVNMRTDLVLSVLNWSFVCANHDGEFFEIAWSPDWW